MKLINSSFEIIEQTPGLEGMWKHVELCSRIAYMSTDLITNDSYKRFLKMIYDRGHWSCFEHATVYLIYKYPRKSWNTPSLINFYRMNKYSKINSIEEDDDIIVYITSNMRVILENGRMEDLDKYWSEKTENHIPRYSVKLITDIGVSREGNRHRNSITESSTRYCNFSKDKFGGEISIMHNSDITQSEFYPIEAMNEFILNENAGCTTDDYWYAANIFCEFCYMKLLEKGWTPQQARRILPLDLKTEVIYTAFIDDWKHLLKLRTASDAHPDFREIAIPLKEEFINRGYVCE